VFGNLPNWQAIFLLKQIEHTTFSTANEDFPKKNISWWFMNSMPNFPETTGHFLQKFPCATWPKLAGAGRRTWYLDAGSKEKRGTPDPSAWPML